MQEVVRESVEEMFCGVGIVGVFGEGEVSAVFGFLWVLVSSCGFLWVLVGSCGFLWGCVSFPIRTH